MRPFLQLIVMVIILPAVWACTPGAVMPLRNGPFYGLTDHQPKPASKQFSPASTRKLNAAVVFSHDSIANFEWVAACEKGNADGFAKDASIFTVLCPFCAAIADSVESRDEINKEIMSAVSPTWMVDPVRTMLQKHYRTVNIYPDFWAGKRDNPDQYIVVDVSAQLGMCNDQRVDASSHHGELFVGYRLIILDAKGNKLIDESNETSYYAFKSSPWWGQRKSLAGGGDAGLLYAMGSDSLNEIEQRIWGGETSSSGLQ